MSLTRADQAYNWDGDNIFFPMTDGKHRIVCRVSREALEDRASAEGRGELLNDLVQVFLMHRVEIEKIASNKHDAGDKDHLVKSADLTPSK